MTTPAAASAVNVSNATSAPAVAPGEVPVDAEKVSMKDAVERIEKEVGKNTPEAKEAIKGLIAAWNKDHGVLAFGKRNWIALTAGSVATVLVVGGVIYWVRRRSALAAAAVEAAAATAGLEVALIDGVSRGLV
jgi:sensor c-di-GMP phosphodiesterase-like protein